MTDRTNPAHDTHSGGRKGDKERHHFRFHRPHVHLHSLYGDDWFALKAEKFARFFGTPTFLIVQTVIVGIWMLVNIVGVTQFDVYPFILLNLDVYKRQRSAPPSS